MQADGEATQRQAPTTGGMHAPPTTANTEKDAKPSRSEGSTSSEEEPESSVSTTSDEEDPLRRSQGGVNCAAGSYAAATVANGRALCLTKLAKDSMWRKMRLRRGILCDSPPPRRKKRGEVF